jgi:DNA-binding NarL/FixJ family response regulator
MVGVSLAGCDASQRNSAALGAHPFERRCDQQLAACGLAPAKRRGLDRARLTPQELAVARLVAEGRTNREVAAELVVSGKTVEFHLRNVFAKLGVTSRSQLVLRMRERPQG